MQVLYLDVVHDRVTRSVYMRLEYYNVVVFFSAAQTLTAKCKSLHDTSDLKLYDLVFLEPNPASGLQIP